MIHRSDVVGYSVLWKGCDWFHRPLKFVFSRHTFLVNCSPYRTFSLSEQETRTFVLFDRFVFFSDEKFVYVIPLQRKLSQTNETFRCKMYAVAVRY